MFSSFLRIGSACAIGGLALLGLAATGYSETVVDKTVTRVMGDQPVGSIKKSLAGVSLGGDTAGITTFTDPLTLSAMDGLGIRYVRLEVVTSDSRGLYNPQTGAYNWERLEREIEGMKGSGAEVIANVFYTPRAFAFHQDNHYFYSYPRDYAEWEQYVEAIVRHLNVTKGYGIKYWEIGNEPSGGHFFRASMDEFARYYAATARAIKRADPSAQVGGLGDNPQYPEHWRGLFDYCKAHDVPVDFISFHWYGQWTRHGDTPPYLLYQYAKSLQGMGRETFGKELPVLLTEWSLVGESPDPVLAKVGAYLGTGLYWLQESPVEAALYFRVKPHRKTMGSLLDAQAQWRTLARIFAMFTGLPEQRINLVSVHPGIVGLAARNEDSLAVMLTRFDPDRAGVTVENTVSVLEHGLSGQYRLSVFVENAATAEQSGFLKPQIERTVILDGTSPLDVVIEMENFSVAYLRLEKVESVATEQTVFADSFALGSGRTAGAGIGGRVAEGSGSWRSFGGHSAQWGKNGGVIAGNAQGVGYGSAEGRVTGINLTELAGAGAATTVTLKASFILGSTKEWVAIGFLDGGTGDWWSQGKPLWLFLRPSGQISLSGDITSANPANPAPSYSVASVAGFSADKPVEVAIVYDSATQGFNILVNGVNTTAGWGMRMKQPLGQTASAAGFLINGSNGVNPQGQLPQVLSASLSVRSF